MGPPFEGRAGSAHIKTDTENVVLLRASFLHFFAPGRWAISEPPAARASAPILSYVETGPFVGPRETQGSPTAA